MSLAAGLQELISALGGLSPDSDTVRGAEASIGAVRSSISMAAEASKEAANTFTRAFATLAEGAVGSTDPIQKLSAAAKLFKEDVEAVSQIADKIPIIGDAFQIVGTVMSESVMAIADLSRDMTQVTDGFDQMSRPIREIRQAFADLGMTMGMSFEETRSYADQFAQMFSGTRPEFFINPDDIKEVTVELARQSIGFSELTESINTTVGSMQKQEAIVMLARSTGESFSETVSTISDGMMTLGMSFEASLAQYGLISDVTERTGLQFKDVKDALEGAVRGFERLGINMGFAAPIFDGFVTSLERVGLGIKQATGLARTLVNAIGSLTTNYEKMFIISQRGGLDFGAGQGVFGASIGFQARMLEAEQTGDQAAVGLELANAMRETLASFTGGELVTVQEAAASPELQNTFVMQQKILQDMFGVSGNDAARTIEMLKSIDDATVSGNEELKRELGEQISGQVEKQDATLDEAEKTNAILRNVLSQMTVGNELAILQADLTAGIAGGLGESFRSALSGAGELLERKGNEMANLDITQMTTDEMTAAIKASTASSKEAINRIKQSLDLPTFEEGTEAKVGSAGELIAGEMESRTIKVEIKLVGDAAQYFEAQRSFAESTESGQ